MKASVFSPTSSRSAANPVRRMGERKESSKTSPIVRGPLGRLWDRAVLLPITRFMEGVVLRRQFERFYLVFGGHVFFQTLRTAVQLDLFSLLSKHGALTRSEIARHLGIAEQPARIVLLGLTASGLLRKKGDRYCNTHVAQRMLVPSSPYGVTSYVELQHAVMYKGMRWMLDAVRAHANAGLKEFEGDEPTLYERLAHYPELERIFQDAMQELSFQANAHLARFGDFSGIAHIADVGGGDGTNLIQLARHWPHLRGTVFDSPTVCEIAGKNIEASGLADRLDACPGNCFEDPFPKGVDCLLFAHFFTIWSPEKDRSILKKCYEALPSGGKVMIFNMMQRNDERGPLTAGVGSPYFLTLATGEGMLYTWREYETWMKEAGFRALRKRALPLDHGVIIGTKP